MEECIKVENLRKSYAGRTVVNNISFTVKKGEVFGFLGHNGAGKSTTIETILGLKKADTGTFEILHQNPQQDKKKLFERVGVQLQSSNFQYAIRVDEICEEISALYKEPADYRELLKKFHLDHFINAKVSKLSGGEKQKLSVVIALIPKPELIFLDELTTGLDVAARREVWKILKELKNEGTTIFLTTHYMDEAQYLCDRVFLIKNGEKVTEGTVDEIVKSSPYNTLEDAYLWYMGEEI